MVPVVPLAKLAHDVLRVTVLALIGFALLNWAADKANIPGLKAALGRGGVSS